jgi:deazaflavin-dependent oxidoreductase (nitroreductase family)
MTTTDLHNAITATSAATGAHYQRPDWFTRNVMNRLVNRLTRMGLSVWGSRVLEHKGRISGTLHHTPVNVLTIDSTQYLIAPRGTTEWVRNVRANQGNLVLQLGRRRHEYTTIEVPVTERTAILRAYLARWKFEVGMFFDGVGPDSTDAEFEAIADRHPVFVLHKRSAHSGQMG